MNKEFIRLYQYALGKNGSIGGNFIHGLGKKDYDKIELMLRCQEFLVSSFMVRLLFTKSRGISASIITDNKDTISALIGMKIAKKITPFIQPLSNAIKKFNKNLKANKKKVKGKKKK